MKSKVLNENGERAIALIFDSEVGLALIDITA